MLLLGSCGGTSTVRRTESDLRAEVPKPRVVLNRKVVITIDDLPLADFDRYPSDVSDGRLPLVAADA